MNFRIYNPETKQTSILDYRKPNPKYGTKPRVNGPSRGERRAAKRLAIATAGRNAALVAYPSSAGYSEPGSLKCK